MNFEKLRMMRSRCGLSVTEISQRSGVPEPTVKRIFSGKTSDPQFQTVAALVRAMGGSLDEMMDDGILHDTPIPPKTVESKPTGITSDPPKAADDPHRPLGDPPKITDDPLQIIRDPAANPDEASQIEEMENMIESLKHIIESYKERIAEQTSRHEKEIERMTAAHTDRINSLTKDKIALAIVTGFLILFIVFLFSYDILNPSVGWFQR